MLNYFKLPLDKLNLFDILQLSFRKNKEKTMFTANIDTFRTQQKELHSRAAHYRLVKSLEKSESFSNRLTIAIGKLMIASGRGLLVFVGLFAALGAIVYVMQLYGWARVS